jgi:biopolymer transport protein ExbB
MGADPTRRLGDVSTRHLLADYVFSDLLCVEGNASEKILHRLDNGDNLLSRALAPALKKLSKGREKTENLFIENLEAEENSVSQWVTYLNVIASVAPMIGLLGTVSGMISAFQTIGRGGMGRPELLAGDIGEALITTATGLVIGIPAMIAYFILRNRLNNAMIATAQAGSELIEAAETASNAE